MLNDYETDAMCEAFHRLIEAHAQSNSPFHNPVASDAQIALRHLRAVMAAAKAKPDADEQAAFEAWCPYRGSPDPRVVWAAAWKAKSGPVVDVPHLITAARMVTQYRLMMSYNDSYFGEPAGVLKARVHDLERALPPIYPAAAIKGAAPSPEGDAS